MHGSTVMSFQRQVMVLKGSGHTGHRSEVSGLGHKKRNTWLGLCHTLFSQNRMLIVCVPRNQVYTHTVQKMDTE
jgi:hypothetical protein